MLEEKSSIKIMKRSAIREAAFKLIYSFEIQEPENLEEQIDLYLECEEITDKEAKESLNQLNGGLSLEINAIKKKLLDVMADIEATIDYPEYDIEEVTEKSIRRRLEEVKIELEKQK